MGIFRRRRRESTEVSEPVVEQQAPSDEPSAQPVETIAPVVEPIETHHETSAPAVESSAPPVAEGDPGIMEKAPELVEDAAEDRLEHDAAEEARVANRGLNPMWRMKRHDDELSRREVRAAADPESDTAETLFIKSEREAEEYGRE